VFLPSHQSPVQWVARAVPGSEAVVAWSWPGTPSHAATKNEWICTFNMDVSHLTQLYSLYLIYIHRIIRLKTFFGLLLVMPSSDRPVTTQRMSRILCYTYIVCACVWEREVEISGFYKHKHWHILEMESLKYILWDKLYCVIQCCTVVSLYFSIYNNDWGDYYKANKTSCIKWSVCSY
jgi:hypothetical protein